MAKRLSEAQQRVLRFLALDAGGAAVDWRDLFAAGGASGPALNVLRRSGLVERLGGRGTSPTWRITDAGRRALDEVMAG